MSASMADYALGLLYDQILSTKRYVSKLVTPVINATMTEHFCLDLRLILQSRMYVTMSYQTHSGQAHDSQRVLDRKNSTGLDWNHWQLNIRKPSGITEVAFQFEFRTEGRGSGVAVMIDALIVHMDGCHSSDYPDARELNTE